MADLLPWLADHWDPELTLRDWWERLADEGWAVPTWSTAWAGRGLSLADAVALNRAIVDFGAVPGPGGFGGGLVGPTLLVNGDDGQRSRHLPAIATGALAWCQLFSEPGAGSDLAGLQTRAGRDGATWVVSGQKVWTSGGQIADWAMLLARTDVDVPKHAGISYFLIDMHQPGVEVRPLREMTGRSFFNEVFLTEARVSADDLVGGEGNGWVVANTTLGFERALAAAGGSQGRARPGTVAGDLDRRAGEFSASGATAGEPREPGLGIAAPDLHRSAARSIERPGGAAEPRPAVHPRAGGRSQCAARPVDLRLRPFRRDPEPGEDGPEPRPTSAARPHVRDPRGQRDAVRLRAGSKRETGSNWADGSNWRAGR